MTLSFVNNITPALASKRGFHQFGIILSNWGNQGATADSESLITKVQNYSIAGLAIAPNSTLTRVRLGPGPTGATGNQAWGPDYLITPESPFIGDIPGPWILQTDAQSHFGDFYWPSGTNTNTVFGPNMGVDADNTRIFGGGSSLFPSVSLIAYLSPPTSFVAETTRFTDTVGFTSVTAGTTLRVYAIPGKTKLRALFKANSTLTSMDVRVTTAPGGWVPSVLEEIPANSAITLATNEEKSITIDPLVNAYWVFIHIGDIVGPTPAVAFRIEAE